MTLRAEHCGLSYAGKAILRDVSLELKPGEILAVVGPNGAGKSSLVGLLAGTSQPTLGSVTLDNQLYTDLSLAARATQLAVLPQHTSLDFPFTVDEIVEMGRIPHGGNARMHAPMRAEIAELLGLEALRERVYTTLSGGEKQRTQLARVLCQLWDGMPGSYFLFDEPTAALDIAHQLAFMSLARQLVEKGAGVLMVMHDINLAARYADRLLLLKDGEVMGMGAPAEVLTNERVKAAFGVTPEVVQLADGSRQWLFVE